MLNPPPPIRPRKNRPASAVLEELVAAFPGERMGVGEMVDLLDSRAHGVLLLVLALPMCVPNVPGISTIFGFLMLAPAIQLSLGAHRLWLPNRARAWSIDCNAIRRTIHLAVPTLKRVETLIRPRWTPLTRFPLTIAVGLQTLLMALILILPIPFANWPPGMTVAMTAIALLQRDGVLMLLTIPAAVASAASVYFGTKIGLAIMHGAIHWVQGLFGA